MGYFLSKKCSYLCIRGVVICNIYEVIGCGFSYVLVRYVVTRYGVVCGGMYSMIVVMSSMYDYYNW